MGNKIIANDEKHLKWLIDEEVRNYGNECNLNHINISKVTDLSFLFDMSRFNGDISKWNTSNVTNMNYLFYESQFNGDVSNWRPLKVKVTKDMFLKSKAPIPYWLGKDSEEILKKIESYDLFEKLSSELNDKEIQAKKLKI